MFANGDGKSIAIGVVIVCLLPFMMVLYAGWFVWRHILPYEGRRAAWILLEDPENSEVKTPSSQLLEVSLSVLIMNTSLVVLLTGRVADCEAWISSAVKRTKTER